MPNVVQPMLEKILPNPTPPPPAPKKTALKSDSNTFDDELKKAKPKPRPEQTNQKTEAKKPARTAKPKKQTDETKPEAADEDAAQSDAVADEQSADEAPDHTAKTDNVEPAKQTQTDSKPTKPSKTDGEKRAGTDPRKLAEDASDLVQAVNPDAQQKQQQPNAQDQTDNTDGPQKKQSDAPVQAIGSDAAKKVAVNPKQSAKAKTDDKTKANVKATDAEKAAATAVADANDAASDEAADDGQTAASDEPAAAKVARKSATEPDPSQQANDAQKPEPVELGAALKQEKPDATVRSTAKSDGDDDDAQAPQRLADAAERPAPDDPDSDVSAAPAHVAMAQAADPALQPKPAAIANPAPVHAQSPAPPAPPAPPEVRFAEANHSQIVTGMRGQLLPDGGTMHIRLDPPELGALQVSVHMQDGVMTATFQTSNDDATRLLSHSLAQLKHVLESQGVSVDKLHVTQAPREQESRNDGNGRQQNAGDNSQARQEQQRREILNRMWRRLTNGSDPLDMVV